MTIFPGVSVRFPSYRPARISVDLTWEGLRRMLHLHPAVAVVAIVGAVLVVLAALAAITFLAYNGRGTEAIGAFLLGGLVLVLRRLRAVEGRVIDAQSSVAGGQSTSDVSAPDGAGSLAPQGIAP